jgi:hypothetical protein
MFYTQLLILMKKFYFFLFKYGVICSQIFIYMSQGVPNYFL